MNKFFILALVACLAGAAVANPLPEASSEAEINDEASQLALFETDEIETKALGTEKAIFADFCLSARDDVRAYLKESVNAGAARVFNLMVETVGQVSEAIAKANSVAVEDGSKMVGQDARQMKQAVGGVVTAVGGTAKQQLMAVLNNLKEQLTTENLKDVADEACVNVGMGLKPTIEKKFSAYKKEMLKSPQGEQYAEVLAKTRLENLGCVTTSRLTKVATGCNMIRTVAPSLFEFIGY